MTCRTCKFLDVLPDKDGKRRVRQNNAYRCLVPLPEVAWPDSVLEAYGSHLPTKTFMSPDRGKNCQTHEERS